jgi:hypothetical protein
MLNGDKEVSVGDKCRMLKVPVAITLSIAYSALLFFISRSVSRKLFLMSSGAECNLLSSSMRRTIGRFCLLDARAVKKSSGDDISLVQSIGWIALQSDGQKC